MKQTVQERRRTIAEALHGSNDRPFSFRNCPVIMKMVMAADGREHLEGSHRQQIIMKHERTLRELTAGKTLDEKVLAVEKYLDSLPGGTISQNTRSPFASKPPKIGGWGD